MKLLKITASLLVLTALTVAQQPPSNPPGGVQAGSQPAAAQQPTQPAVPAGPAGAQPQGQQPQQPGSQQPAQPQTPSGQESGMQPAQSPSLPSASTQHPDYPAGPGLIEGCLSQVAGGYVVRPTEGGLEFALVISPQAAQNNVDPSRDFARNVGKQVKVYGYPASPASGETQATGNPAAPTPSAAGALHGDAAASASGPAPMGASQGQAPTAAGSATSAHTLQVTRFIPLNRPCGAATSQSPQNRTRQSAAE